MEDDPLFIQKSDLYDGKQNKNSDADSESLNTSVEDAASTDEQNDKENKNGSVNINIIYNVIYSLILFYLLCLGSPFIVVCCNKEIFVIPKNWKISDSTIRWPNVSVTAAQKLVKKKSKYSKDWEILNDVNFMFYCCEYYCIPYIPDKFVVPTFNLSCLLFYC